MISLGSSIYDEPQITPEPLALEINYAFFDEKLEPYTHDHDCRTDDDDEEEGTLFVVDEERPPNPENLHPVVVPKVCNAEIELVEAIEDPTTVVVEKEEEEEILQAIEDPEEDEILQAIEDPEEDVRIQDEIRLAIEDSNPVDNSGIPEEIPQIMQEDTNSVENSVIPPIMDPVEILQVIEDTKEDESQRAIEDIKPAENTDIDYFTFPVPEVADLLLQEMADVPEVPDDLPELMSVSTFINGYSTEIASEIRPETGEEKSIMSLLEIFLGEQSAPLDAEPSKKPVKKLRVRRKLI